MKSVRRIRDFAVRIGHLPTGPLNAITDIRGVKVGHVTIESDSPHVLRTGVTVVHPHPDILERDLYAGVHTFNGSGEFAGAIWIEESGLLSSPIALTATHSIGRVRDAFLTIAAEHGRDDRWWLPAVAETYDGWLSDGPHAAVGIEHVRAALASATEGAVEEGCVGGGTGMICHGFKSGIGTSSRMVQVDGKTFCVGTLVQANHGIRSQLRIGGIPVGEIVTADIVPTPDRSDLTAGSSIIVITATDAPLNPTQCKRLARRATVGLARAGGLGHDGSGDIFLAFSTAQSILSTKGETTASSHLSNSSLNQLFAAVADTTEESILNALCAATDRTGRNGRKAMALPHSELERALNRSTSEGIPIVKTKLPEK